MGKFLKFDCVNFWNLIAEIFEILIAEIDCGNSVRIYLIHFNLLPNYKEVNFVHNSYIFFWNLWIKRLISFYKQNLEQIFSLFTGEPWYAILLGDPYLKISSLYRFISECTDHFSKILYSLINPICAFRN